MANWWDEDETVSASNNWWEEDETVTDAASSDAPSLRGLDSRPLPESNPAPAMPEEVDTPSGAPDHEGGPFEGESFGDLTARRGQQFARGATEVIASIPESAAVAGAISDERKTREAGEFATEREKTIADIRARLAEPDLDDRTRGFLEGNLAALGAGQEVLGDMASEEVVPAQERELFARGDEIRRASEETFGKPDPRDTSFWGKVAEGGGNMSAMALSSVAAGLVGGPAAGLALGAGVGSSLNTSALYKEAIEAGADEETARDAAKWGAAIGATEIIPISRAIKLLPPKMRKEAAGRFLRAFTHVAKSSGEEAAQEFTATVLNNMVAQKLYDPDRGWTEGALESAAVGAVLGGGTGAAGATFGADDDAASTKARSGNPPPSIDTERRDSPRLSESDRSSPLRNDLIDDGKRLMEEATSGRPPAPRPAQPPAPKMDTPPDVQSAPTRPQGLGQNPATPADDSDMPEGAVPATDVFGDEADETQGNEAVTSGTEKMDNPPPVQAEPEAAPASSAETESEFEIMDETEMVDGESRPTGRKVRVNLSTGQAEVISPETAAPTSTAPVEAPALQPAQEANDQAREEPLPQATQPSPDAAPMAAPPAEREINRRNIETLTEREIASVGTDAKTFQYKEGGDESGVTDRLRGIKKWESSRAGLAIVYEYEDGRRVIADGHQRLGLAKKLAGEGQEIDLPVYVLRERDGVSPSDARRIAAEKNIAEGSGTALDAAKVLRESGRTLEDANLPTSGQMARDAEAISKLSDDAFGMVINEAATDKHGAAVGRLVPDPARHRDVLALVAKLKPSNQTQLEAIVRQAAETEVRETQDSLFGEEEVSANLYLERAKVIDRAMKDLGREIGTFRTLSERSDSIKGAGNVLNESANAERLDADSRARATLMQQANTKGPISDALTAAARTLKEGGKVADAARQFTETVRRAEAGKPQPQPGTEARGPRDGDGQAQAERAEAPAGRSEAQVEQTPEGEQYVIPGAERRDPPPFGGPEARPDQEDLPEGGLFDEGARRQADINDFLSNQSDSGRRGDRSEEASRRADDDHGAAAPEEEVTGPGSLADFRADPLGYLRNLPDADAATLAKAMSAPVKKGGDPRAAIERRFDYLSAAERDARVAKWLEGRSASGAAARADIGNRSTKSGTKTPKPGSAEKIEDFGEQITGAAKDLRGAYSRSLDAVPDDDISAQPLSKSFPAPDYAKLLEDGADPWTVAFIHAARDAIPNKPRAGWKLGGWVAQVQALRGFAQSLLDGKISPEQVKTALAAKRRLSVEMDGPIRLYQELGHDTSFKGVTMGQATYSIFEGKVQEPPLQRFEITRPSKGSTLSTFPRVLAHGKTEDEAVASLRTQLAGGALDAAAKVKAPRKFLIYSYKGREGFYVGAKLGRDMVDLAHFDDVTAARKMVREQPDELEAALQRLRDVPSERRSANAPRVGKDHRGGAPVTPEAFAETFGFRGVQFGNYVENDRRQADLNEAYDALMDLAGVLGVEPKALSLNGELGLAFGARGKGGKNAGAAHYEPDQVVINLTKNAGAGSLGHEWFHALDNYFERSRGRPTSYMTDGNRAPKGETQVRPEVVEAFRALREAIRKTDMPKRSKVVDRTRSKDYWSTNIELGARAFESYLIAKLRDQKAANDYLANIVDEAAFNADLRMQGYEEDGFPYPTDAEMAETIRPAFDGLFEAIETKQTPKGVAMFSLSRRVGREVIEEIEPEYRFMSAEPLAGDAAPKARAVEADTSSLDLANTPAETVDKVFTGEMARGAIRWEISERALEGADRLALAIDRELAEAGLPNIQSGVSERLFGRLPSGTLVELDGAYYDGAILVSMASGRDPLSTTRHEMIHALRSPELWGREYGLFRRAEWDALERAARNDKARLAEKAELYEDEEIAVEEVIADMYADWVDGKQAKGFLKTAFEKIRAAIAAVRAALRGEGFPLTEDAVFRRVQEGEVGRRQGEIGEEAGDARFAISPRERDRINAQGGDNAPFLPDRKVWDSIKSAQGGIWSKLKAGGPAAHDAVDRARILLQDRFLPILRAQEAVMRSTGEPIPEEQNAYIAEETFSGKVGRHLFEIDEEFTKPIIDLIAETKGELTVDQVGEWLTARHAVERNAQIAKINPAMPDGGSGMKDAKAKAVLAAAASGPHAARLKAIGDMIDNLRERTITLREDAGLLTPAEARIWRTQYKHYVPLKGFAETDHSDAALDITGMGRRFNTRGQESKRALGRESEAFNPLQAALTQAQEVAIRAEKNRVGQSLYRLIEANPSPMWEVKTPEQKRYFNRSTGLVETRTEPDVTPFLNPNEMALKIAGEERRILFHDSRLARAAGTVGADQMGGIVRAGMAFSRWFSSVNTMLNPEFVVANAFRDMTAAQVNIRNFGEEDRAKIAKAMVRNWPKAFRAAYRGQLNKADTEWTKFYREYEKAGAKVSFWQMDQPEAGKSDLEKRIRRKGGTALQRAGKYGALSTRDNPLLSFIERVNLSVDNAVRLSAYVEARRAGWTEAQAASLSKNLTVNFNRRGEMGPQLNAFYPFYNAAMQGSQILVRAAQGKSGKTVRRLMLAMVAAGFLEDQVNALLSAEDDDDELAWDKVPDWKQRKNLMLMMPGGENPISIPLPYGYNLFPYAGKQLSKLSRGVKEPGDALADLLGTAFEAFSPISGRTVQETVTPTVLQPIVEMTFNRDWQGRSIRPEDPYADYGPDAYKFYPGATELSKGISDVANRLTGGTRAESGLVDVSPEYLDHMFGFATGGAGRFVGRTADLASTLAFGTDAEREDLTVNDVPFVRQLRYNTADWLDQDRYYRFRDQVREAVEAVEVARETKEPVSEGVRNLAALEGRLKLTDKQVRRLGKEMKAVDTNTRLSAERRREMRKAIEDRRLRLMLGFNSGYVKRMGPQGE